MAVYFGESSDKISKSAVGVESTCEKNYVFVPIFIFNLSVFSVFTYGVSEVL